MFRSILLSLVLRLNVLVLGLPFPNDDPVGVVWTFPNVTWIENLAVRQNGAVLCTSISASAIFQVDPFAHTETTIHQFAITDNILGIAEMQNDVFVVVSANISTTTSTAWPGSAKIWKVDMTEWELGVPNAIRLITNLPDVGLPDGVTLLGSDTGVVLVADAGKGIVWRVDTTSGEYTIAIKDNLFLADNPQIPLGVDGIHILDGTLYFTNLAADLLGKVALTANGSAAGPVQNITTKLTIPDDFEVAADGTVYVVGDNTLWRVSPKGKVDVLAGGAADVTLEGATAAQLGRTVEDEDVLYISTNGGLLQVVKGDLHGGQLLAVNIGLYD